MGGGGKATGSVMGVPGSPVTAWIHAATLSSSSPEGFPAFTAFKLFANACSCSANKTAVPMCQGSQLLLLVCLYGMVQYLHGSVVESLSSPRCGLAAMAGIRRVMEDGTTVMRQQKASRKSHTSSYVFSWPIFQHESICQLLQMA